MYKYKFRNYEKILRGNYVSYFIEVIDIDNLTKEETIMKQINHKIPLPPIDVPCAYVTVKAGATVPIPGKRYHSARIDVGLSYPCHPEKIDDVFEKVRDWVDDRMRKEYEEMTGEGSDGQER